MLTDDELARLCEPMCPCGDGDKCAVNARIAELAAHIRELQARYREVDKDHAAICARLQDCVRKYDIGFSEGRVDVDVVAHIAGEPARTAQAVAAELRRIANNQNMLDFAVHIDVLSTRADEIELAVSEHAEARFPRIFERRWDEN
jgi:hypothetical protein